MENTDMKMYGYSERGAMNALFYGIALNEDKDAMKAFLKEANIQGTFMRYEFYMEFSLSDFGAPDLVVVATNEKGYKTTIFIEAKVSCFNKYNLETQCKKHVDFINGNNNAYDASNLFFQLRLKHLFAEGNDDEIAKKRSQKKDRSLGKNKIVEKFADKIKAENYKYIAIIPSQKHLCNVDDYKDCCGFHIDYVYWENLYVNKCLEKYLKDTIDVNSAGQVSQILNN